MKHVLAFFLMLSLLLAGINTHAGGRPGGGFRSSSSSRSSYGGFRSGSSSGYRSFSARPPRTFTYGSRSSYTAPRASAPATSRSSYRSSSKTTVNNHYHGGGTASGGSGLGLMDYVILDNMLSHDRGPSYGSASPSVVSSGVLQQDNVTAVVYQEETHYWRNFFFVVLGLGLLYGLFRLFRAVEDVN